MRTAIVLATIAVLALAAASPLAAQGPATHVGPVVPHFGRVFDVPDAALVPPRDQDLKLRFDVSAGAEPGAVNTGFETVARFLNMHGRAGVPREHLHTALVVHGTAGKDTLTAEAYRRRYGKDNPNLALLDELKAAGVRIYLCGQTAAARNLPRGEVTPAAAFALSAMTAHLALDREGYALNPF
ncbi:MAG: DsrE family protein [Dehalococcoidia bacterium]